jgi:NADH-quinone oxidoreductase subunit D
VGVRKDLRLSRSETYASYWYLSLTSYLGRRGDSYDRFLIRVREMYESVHIVFQVLSNLTDGRTFGSKSFFDLLFRARARQLNRKVKYTSMEALISHFKKYSEGVRVPRGFTYVSVEAPKGEFGVALVSDGSSKPYRCKIRTPAYHHMHVMPRMLQGHYMADLITVLGSQDIVFGDVDR